ncbi:unnamed protein product [Paramecium primaurelia]|uniref:Uncharacterized protein n=1 Tax=Paramecium primaurelia TaxID=5886 RepID=A0A8S1K681_PARPR|nr:unnamed protein product [Paramecium primaurelia]
MDQCKTYSHIRSISSCKSKHKISNKSRDLINPRKRSVTFNSDVDLIKSISCQENLLDLIGKVQKQKQDYLLSLQNSQMSLLPPLKVEEEEIKTSKQQVKKQTNKEYYEFTIPMDPYKKQLYQKLNIYGKFIEPTQYKKIDYQQIQTFESAISQIQFQECNKDKINKLQEQDTQKQMDKLISQVDDTQRFNQQYYSNYNQDYDLFQEQQKMNKIINEALKFKQQKREPINASKSVKQKRTQMRNYLENQYQNALNSVMQGININTEEDNLFIRKKYQKRIKLNTSFNNSRITSQYTKKAISSQIIHPDRQDFVNKTLEIYDKCNTYLN